MMDVLWDLREEEESWDTRYEAYLLGLSVCLVLLLACCLLGWEESGSFLSVCFVRYI